MTIYFFNGVINAVPIIGTREIPPVVVYDREMEACTNSLDLTRNCHGVVENRHADFDKINPEDFYAFEKNRWLYTFILIDGNANMNPAIQHRIKPINDLSMINYDIAFNAIRYAQFNGIADRIATRKIFFS